MNEHKLCINCKNYQAPWSSGFSAARCPSMCFAEALRGPLNLETGARPATSEKPVDLRKEGGACGPDGLLFEEKPPEQVEHQEQAIAHEKEIEAAINKARADKVCAPWWKFW